MPKKESQEEFFARSRGKGSNTNYELEHPRATPDDIETSKDWTRCIAYGIEGAYGDDIAGLGSVVRSWKDLTAGWQWAERKPKIDPEVVTTISNDITFAVFQNEDGRAEFAMQVVRDAKNMTFKPDKRPEHSLHEGLQPRPLFCNPILTYLAKFIAKGVFRDYKTMDALLSLEPIGDEMFQLYWDPEVLDLPFFQKDNGQIDTADILSKRLRELGFRSGYEFPPTIHDFRAEGLFLIGSYFGDELRSTVNNRFRSITLCRNPELWQSLPAEKQHELESSPEFTAIEQELEALSLDTRDGSAVMDRRKELRAEKRKLIAEELRKSRKLQPSRIPSNKDENHLTGYHQTIFSRVRALMPERDRLASSLFTVASIRSEEGRAVLCDMIALYQQETEVAVRLGLEPEKCLCLLTESKRKIDSKPAAQRWRHIYSCYRKSLRASCGFAEMCFFCSEWVMGKDQWENHCQVHLNGYKPLPAQCDPLFYGGTLASPGICPFCLNDATLSAAERMHQFLDKVEWRDHISDHFGIFEKYARSLHEGSLPKCPVSRPHCPSVFVSAQEVKFHLQNNHGAEFVKRAKKSRPLDEVDARCPKSKRVRSIIKHEPATDVRECSKLAYGFVYQTAEQWCRKGHNASNPAAIHSQAPPNTAAPVGDNTIRLSLRQTFTITSLQDLTDVDEEPQALEASESLTHIATAPRALMTPANNSNWLDLSTVTDTLLKEKPLVESTNILTYKDIATEKEERKCFDEHFMSISNLLDPDLQNIQDYAELPDLYISGAYSSLSNGSTESISTSHQDSEYQQPSKQAIQETRPSAMDPEDNQFEVERVIDDQVVLVGRGRRKKMITQYWVKWKGYPKDDNSWVNKADIHKDLIKAYMAGKSLDD
ncbi:hypothetical protein LARI1_G009008 [Lachnellula arida]|uniref:Chromo domain-containing protein n=1 Tax=Lachnellula arida TaxID=1316785 RepID=A0A8T9B2C6_9HELO|nr:hypothetical protein LARI1_G009008 [Lachnellula arida]